MARGRPGAVLRLFKRALLTLLHSLGAVLWLDEPWLRDTVVLDPQFAIDGISRVIRNFEVHRKPVTASRVGRSSRGGASSSTARG